MSERPGSKAARNLLLSDVAEEFSIALKSYGRAIELIGKEKKKFDVDAD